MFKAVSRSEIEYAFFVSKIVGPYDQPVREAVDYAERYPLDPTSEEGGWHLVFAWEVFCSRRDRLLVKHPTRLF